MDDVSEASDGERQMSNETATPQAKPTNLSTIKRLIQAAALAAILVPLGSVAVESATVTCGFGGTEGYGGPECGALEFIPTATTSRFDFGSYYLELEFVLVNDASVFNVTVDTSDGMSQAEWEARAGAFSSYTCIFLTQAGPCVAFEVLPDESQAGNWSSYEIEIRWFKWDGQAYNPALMRMLHAMGGTGDEFGIFDEDMCVTALTNPSYLPCEVDPDPAIRSGDTAFQFFTAALAPDPVPEPASLILLATGLSGVLYGRRRRTKG